MPSGRRQGKPIQQKNAGGKKVVWTNADLRILKDERAKNPPTPYEDIVKNFFTLGSNNIARHTESNCRRMWNRNFKPVAENAREPPRRSKRAQQMAQADQPVEPVEPAKTTSQAVNKRKRANDEEEDDESEPEEPPKKTRSVSKSKAVKNSEAATKKATITHNNQA